MGMTKWCLIWRRKISDMIGIGEITEEITRIIGTIEEDTGGMTEETAGTAGTEVEDGEVGVQEDDRA